MTQGPWIEAATHPKSRQKLLAGSRGSTLEGALGAKRIDRPVLE
jgi:hypothetical protein